MGKMPVQTRENGIANESENSFRVLQSSIAFQDVLNKNYTVGVDSGKVIYTGRYAEGFIALNEGEFDPAKMNDSGRTLAVVNPQPVREEPAHLVESRARKRYRKKVTNLWQSLLPDSEDIGSKNGRYSVKSCISKDVSAICAEEFREEYYLPFAFMYDQRPVGGAYMHCWEAGRPEQLVESRKPVEEQRFKEFFTGGCMFGTPLYGIDQFGKKHSLTNPYTEMPEYAKIQFVSSPHRVHPDETLSRESLVNVLNFMMTLGVEQPRLNYHLPLSNYIFYGINWFLRGKMTPSALTAYIRKIRKRAAKQRSFLELQSCLFGIQINAGSTLDALGFSGFKDDTVLEELLEVLKIDQEVPDIDDRENLEKLQKQIFDSVIDYMGKLPGKNGRVWKSINQKIEKEEIPVNDGDLLSLNYLDYSANLATSSLVNGDRETASVLPSHESPVNHWYKKIFAEEFGAVVCFQWLAPLQVNSDSFRNRVFYLDHYIEDINTLLQLGVLPKCFLQTAAVALDSQLLAEAGSRQIDEVLKLHEETVCLRSRRDRVLARISELSFIYKDDSIMAV